MDGGGGYTMNMTAAPGPRSGTAAVPASKSQAHRLLIAAALGSAPCTMTCAGASRDIYATIDCLNALGADIREVRPGEFAIYPISGVPEGECRLPCGESGSTLRFLLPVVGALGARAAFIMEGRLPERPLAPLDAELEKNGMTLRRDGGVLHVSGQLRPGEFTIPGNVSSQYISGLQMALPRLRGSSRVRVEGTLESAAYVTMTEDVMRLAGARIEKTGDTYIIHGGTPLRLPSAVRAEGDWSGAAFFLCMGALSPEGVSVTGLSTDSRQGDRAVLDVLKRFGAEVTLAPGAVAVRRGDLRGTRINAQAIPDLIPALAAVAAAARGETRIYNAARLRLKESDRLKTTAALINSLGGEAEEEADGLVIRGKAALRGGTADSFGDHRIAMSAAVAACACAEAVTVLGGECVSKSFPSFWEELGKLEATK